MSNSRYDFTELRKKLSDQTGRQYWRSLDELADTAEFRDFLHHEFPDKADEWHDGISRRNFLKVMGASLAFAGLTACTRQPVEKIVPYVRQPEDIVPGKPLFYATAMQLGGAAIGLLAESHMGRPTKLEGNPDHPASLGATDVFSQAALLTMYDPDRSPAILSRGSISSWGAFLQVLVLHMAVQKQRPNPGAGLRILTETVISPTLGHQLDELLKTYPGAKWHQYEPLSGDNIREGARQAFGDYMNAYYRFDQAAVVVSLESDFVSCGPGHVRYVRDFISRRKVRGGHGTMNRLYCFESTPSNTGAIADHRFRKNPREIAEIARELYAAITGGGTATAELKGVVADLQKNPGASLVLAGESLSPEIHATVHAMNQTLQNTGKTVIYTDPVELRPVNQMESLRDLVKDMNNGSVETLVILGGNPVYNSPADVGFASALNKVAMRIHLSLYNDETSDLCHWHIPEAHFLEMWSDARAYDGTVSFVQPLIAPLYDGKTAHELIAAMMGKPDPKGYDIIRSYWMEQVPADFEKFWRKSLNDGVIAGTSFQERTVSVSNISPQPVPASQGFTLLIRQDPSVYDGRFSNNGWLQELPRPMTKLTWDNAVLISPATAEKLNVHAEEEVEITHDRRSVRGPIWILPGQADDTATLHLGYGRQRAGHVGNNAGFNVYAIQNSKSPWTLSGAQIRKTGGKVLLACTQNHQSMEGRHLVRSATLGEYEKNPQFAKEMEEIPPRDETLYENYEYKGYAWGMAIDLTACVGCNACVVACVSENNIPVVGKDQVSRGREMQWIRVDRYYEGDLDEPEMFNQPVPCMQCENAPCEVVCPVHATVHSTEGLNDMIYNRCVGTRYCSNNCPYKVRRFNFFRYSDIKTPSLKMMRNPDVTVRTRGVMEKCTYCVQRINYAKIESEKENRKVKDGEIQTACQQVCPAEAIVFGNINDPQSKVSKMKAESLNYPLLAELNTRPRTTYLGKLTEPEPRNSREKQEDRSRRLRMDEEPRAEEYPHSDVAAAGEAPVIGPGYTFASVTDKISSIVLTTRTPRWWVVGFGIVFLLTLLLLFTITKLLFVGVGIWGINIPVGWGFDIVNFVWWIGIGHAGTLISAILLLLRQDWRTSINRFAEAMTLFAVACAGMYPLLHMGRPWLAYWLFPYPNTMNIWPNFRSPLVWDVFAVSTYATVSFLFWFVGLVPDLATLRDRARNRFSRIAYGMLAMGWRGSARHWHRYETAYLLLAGLSTPLVVSVHTVVSFDFAVGIIPGWHATIFPPYFVAGAIYSGFAMVMTLAIPIRALYGLQDFITMRHLHNMAKVMLAMGLLVAYGYMMETFMAWYSGNHYEKFMMLNRFKGPYSHMYWTLILCNVVLPQLFWFPRVRNSVPMLFILSIIVNIGMWLERYVIIVVSLHRDFLPSSWGMYHGTKYDWSMYIGTIGLFLTLLFLFIRVLPMISIFEMRTLVEDAEVRTEEK